MVFTCTSFCIALFYFVLLYILYLYIQLYEKTLFQGILFLSGTGAVFAQGQPNEGPLLSILSLAQTVVTLLGPIMITLALLAFFWFLIKFIWLAHDNPDEQAKAKKGMFYGILGLFVMVSIWGIIAFIQYTLGIDPSMTQPKVGILPPWMRR